MSRHPVRIALAALAATGTLALSACGGGGTPSDYSVNTSAPATPTVASSVTGVAATGKPVAGATVTAIGSDGKTCGSAQTASNGSYTMKTQCASGPVVFAVTAGAPAGSPPLGAIGLPNSSSGTVTGTVNLTPLSTLTLFDFVATQTIVPTAQAQPDFTHILAAVPVLWQAAPMSAQGAQAFGAQLLAAARAVVQAVATQLQTAGVNLASFDPVTTPFAANGQGVDAFFDQYPASAPAANAYQLGSLLSLQLPAQSGVKPVFGGSAGAALSAGGLTSTPTTPTGGTTPIPSGNLRIAVSNFTGALAGSTCSLTVTNGQVGGACTLNGNSYTAYGTYATNAFGSSTLNAHLSVFPSFTLIAIAPSAGAATLNGGWVDPYGQFVSGGGSGNATFQISAP